MTKIGTQIKRKASIFNQRLLSSSILLVFLLTSCTQSPDSCPPQFSGDLSRAAEFAVDDRLPFRFPLDEFNDDDTPFFTDFSVNNNGPESKLEYHAAEDYLRPAGTPVFAMADGKISFSGPMGGYGWLIIIDHPQANIYTLYGHLSPSRWRLESGTVEKGELIGYLGDADENGGSPENPLTPHLHFGIRAGQRSDYPGIGEWRWQAGWIKPCPPELGWLQPSAIITGQEIPIGGFTEPAAELVTVWGVELLFTSIYVLGGLAMLVFAIKSDKSFLLFVYSGVLAAAGWITYTKGTKMSYMLFAMAILFSVIGIYMFVRRSPKMPNTQI